ncbi:hypothetical protein CG017_05742 (plasmid) [Burkholderia glumae]|nr:hypothetical protein CG017_05742 [Burkholderia glumae]
MVAHRLKQIMLGLQAKCATTKFWDGRFHQLSSIAALVFTNATKPPYKVLKIPKSLHCLVKVPVGAVSIAARGVHIKRNLCQHIYSRCRHK